MKNKRELKGNQLCHFLPSFYQNTGHLQIAQELLQKSSSVSLTLSDDGGCNEQIHYQY